MFLRGSLFWPSLFKKLSKDICRVCTYFSDDTPQNLRLLEICPKNSTEIYCILFFGPWWTCQNMHLNYSDTFWRDFTIQNMFPIHQFFSLSHLRNFTFMVKLEHSPQHSSLWIMAKVCKGHQIHNITKWKHTSKDTLPIEADNSPLSDQPPTLFGVYDQLFEGMKYFWCVIAVKKEN